MKVNSIIIVGGGSSGWMTAAAIAYKLPQINLTLIESSKVPPIGVGESTLGHINRFFDLLDLKDEEWMPACNATYKNSIQFTDFYKKDTVFQYPFGSTILPKDLDTEFNPLHALTIGEYYAIKLYCKDISYKDFARYINFNTVLAETNKQTKEQIEGFNFKYDTAYHMSADEFGQFLRMKYCSSINHIIDDIVNVEVDEKGVTSVNTKEKKYTADLYIDCTGFKSLLIEKTLNVKYNDFPNLINDKAVAGRKDYKSIEDRKKHTRNVTDCKAIEHGWLWDTPLWNRLGTGYVYSSQFLTEDQAEEEFRRHLNFEGDVRHISFRHGRHEKAWHKNVIAIGLSYGFIEPLEATGLMTTHENIIKLVHLLQMHDCNINSIDRTQFNNACNQSTDGMSNFVAMHYALSKRNDTNYWQYLTEEHEYDQHVLDFIHRDNNLAKEMTVILNNNMFNINSWDGFVYILSGMNYSPTTTDYLRYIEYDIYDLQEKIRMLKSVIEKRFKMTESMLDNHSFMEKYIYYK